ncbi:AhpD family alkylhydroperoxidase [Leucobacter luti]|uniref:carboxymuconolactone decarboxylase family protein n=1 Tax=Leucobacter luti TaxID=340320 RepID=UPI001046EE0A|nr:carboxymuconolactone decarboxylase family protein [Leucobacter luti]MCW2287221.1 AhpD family alkylhydroperoxidase [Leucobacter luti]TCK41447.1 AhpD family alkylhydroperoxidase [Leucobacter luti]
MSRINISKQHPDVYQQTAALSQAAEAAAAAAGVDPKLVELVKLRVSQLNGCAYCCRLHTRDAVELGETVDRLAVLPAWSESQYFSEQEKAALGLAEEVTRLSVPERSEWENGSLTPEQVSAITWLAIVMGAWNRIAIRSGYRVAP